MAGLVRDADAIQQSIAPLDFGSLAERVCGCSLEQLARDFPAVQEQARPFFCLDLSYAHVLLTRGFKIPDNSTVTLVKKVQYRGELIEAAWPLGAAINLLG